MTTIIIIIFRLLLVWATSNVTITITMVNDHWSSSYIILTEVYLCLCIFVCVSETGGVKVAMGTIHYTLWFNANKDFNPVLKKSEFESGL